MSKSKKLKAKFKEPKKKEVRQIAKEKGIALSKVVNVAKPKYASRGKTKEELILAIQIAEGNTPCYKTMTDCQNTECVWFSSCQ